MAFNSYFGNILGRLLLLLLTLTGIAYLFVANDRFFTLLFLALLAVAQTVLLFIYLNRTNRNLARFLLLLTREDTSVVAWKGKVERTFKGLHHSFRKVNEEISRIRLEKEKGTIMLKSIIQQMHTGIIVIDDTGHVEVVNDPALHLLGVQWLEHISELEKVQEGMSQLVTGLRYDSGNVIRYRKGGGKETPLLVRASLLRLEERNLKILSIQDIRFQLEANEIESWQKMTRVLSHEISNSVTPISTLGEGIHRKLSRVRADRTGKLVIEKDSAAELLQSSGLIQQRCDALVEFMEHYKSFTRLPDPVPEKLKVATFFENLDLLLREDVESQNVSLGFSLKDPSLTISADRKLLDQAFINLVRNSLEALKGKKEGLIQLEASKKEQESVTFIIRDNGTGIPVEIQPEVFTPFFTTKPGGTGIGMSIVRKIVVMSGGTVGFRSEPGHGTEFEIKMPDY